MRAGSNRCTTSRSPERPAGPAHLAWGGQYQWRRDGEYHLFNPETVFRLQHATRAGKYEIFKSYTDRVDDQSRRCMLDSLARGSAVTSRPASSMRSQRRPASPSTFA